MLNFRESQINNVTADDLLASPGRQQHWLFTIGKVIVSREDWLQPPMPFPSVFANFRKIWFTFLFSKINSARQGLHYITAWPCFVIVQWSAVITRSNIVRYYINNYRNWGRISIRCWTLKRHAIPRPHERVIGVFCEYLWENLPHYNGTALYVVITRSDISTRRADITEPLWVWAIPLLTTTKSNHVHRVAANAVTTNAFSLTEHVRS